MLPTEEKKPRWSGLSSAVWVPQKWWTSQEAWIWEQVLAGEVAELEKEYGEAPEARRVSEHFLLDILTGPGFAEAVPHHGVRITGACFPAPLDLSDIVFAHQIWLDGCQFDSKVSFQTARLESHLSLSDSTFNGEVDLFGAKIGGQLTVSGATFERRLNMNGLTVGQNLYLRGADFGGEVDLVGAKIEGVLNADDARFEHSLIMDAVTVGRDMYLRCQSPFKGEVDLAGAEIAFKGEVDLACIRKATFKAKVNLVGAKIGGQLTVSGATFEDDLDMNGLAVGRNLFLRDQATFKGDVDLIGAKVEGTFDASGATFRGCSKMDGLTVTQDLLFRENATFEGNVSLCAAKVGGHFDVSGATFHRTVDASAAVIEGELRLGSSLHAPPCWKPAALLILRNTSLGALQDRIDKELDGKLRDAWPTTLQLEGFTYRRLGGLGGEGESEMIDRSASWYKDWLERDKSFSPQPYRQLANVVREAGADDKANAILYALRQRERREAWSHQAYGRGIRLTLLEWVIGYGIGAGYFRALLWALAFTLTGTFVLWLGSSTPPWLSPGWSERPQGIESLSWCFWASLDEILPVVELNKAHAEFVDRMLTGWREVYFHCHRIFGYVLGSFVVAGLAGLTQGK